MTRPKLRPANRKTQRRWRIPPVLTHGPEVFEGLGVLDEFPGESGVVLWQALRDASLWAEAAPELRAGLFRAGTAPRNASPALPAELAAAVRGLEALRAAPDGADPARVAEACRGVARWAEGAGHLSTALAFAQSAALADPADAEAACEVARLARGLAQHARAETWYRRTVAVARQRGDWASYSRAFLGLGDLHGWRGSRVAARRFHMRAFRAANRNALRELEARALHRLFSSAAGRPGKAVPLAREALALYGAGHPRTPRLAFDVARHWANAGHFARALPVLHAALPRLEGTRVRVSALAEVARASAATGDVEAFMDAWTRAWEAARDLPAVEPPVRAVVTLARGAAAVGAWSKAESAARHALRLAGERSESRGSAAAESLTNAVARRDVWAVEPRAETASAAAAADALAAELVRALRG